MLVNSRTLQSSDSFDFATPFMNLGAGNYTLSIDGNGDNTGAYSFRLLNYTAATALTPGTAVSSTLNPATETDIRWVLLSTVIRMFACAAEKEARRKRVDDATKHQKVRMG